MQDDEPNRPQSRRWIAVVAVPVFYVLSVGPAGWLLNALPDSWEIKLFPIINVIYAPLIYGCEFSPLLASGLRWYVHLL